MTMVTIFCYFSITDSQKALFSSCCCLMEAERGSDCIFLGWSFGVGAETGLGPSDGFLKFYSYAIYFFLNLNAVML